YSIACELNWTKRAEPTGAGSVNAAKRRQHQLRRLPGLPGVVDGLSLAQRQELWLGPGHDGSTFDNPQALRDAWTANRGEVMRLFATNGRRPMGWWQYESPIPWPGYFRQQSALYDAGLLADEEKIALEHRWRAEFERAHGPDFSYTAAPGEILHGAAARKAHLDWADVPHSLRRQWQAARR